MPGKISTPFAAVYRPISARNNDSAPTLDASSTRRVRKVYLPRANTNQQRPSNQVTKYLNSSPRVIGLPPLVVARLSRSAASERRKATLK